MTRDRIRRIGRWLALGLLVAQFGAEIHLYSHALAESSDRMGPAKSCSTCLASSQLQNAVAPPNAEVSAHATAFATVVAEAALPSIRVASFRAFRSRAPPALV